MLLENRLLVNLLVFLFIFQKFSMDAKSQYFRGYTGPGGTDCNYCVQNVIQSVKTLNNRGETLGFNWGAGYPKVAGAGTDNHWQGVQRLPIISGTNLLRNYIVVSSSHRGQQTPYSRFAVVEMGSRDMNGSRLRSNRLERGRLTRDTPPNYLDKIVHTQIITTQYDHPGGMQSIGKYILVGSEHKLNGSTDNSLLTLWDMGNPLSPRLVWKIQVNQSAAISVGIVKLENNKYLVVNSSNNSRTLNFYVINNANIEDANAWQYWDTWESGELKSELRDEDGTIDSKWADFDWMTPFKDAGYQTTNIIKECGTGQLYLIASHGRLPGYPFGIGGDWVDAYRLDVPSEPGNVIITKVAKRHMFPADNTDEFQGDFQAAGGVYISPDNKLYVYATEHGQNGPNNSVKMIEFGPQVPNVEVEAIEDAWIELYEHDNFDGRSIILDYKDRDLRDYNNFDKLERFDDKITSIIYLIPIGHSITLFEHDNQEGKAFWITGKSSVQFIPDLKQLNLNDMLSSAKWNSSQRPEIWIDFNFQGLIQIGTLQLPYSKLATGLAAVSPGGIIKIKSSSSKETITIRKSVILEAHNGPVVIGK